MLINHRRTPFNKKVTVGKRSPITQARRLCGGAGTNTIRPASIGKNEFCRPLGVRLIPNYETCSAPQRLYPLIRDPSILKLCQLTVSSWRRRTNPLTAMKWWTQQPCCNAVLVAWHYNTYYFHSRLVGESTVLLCHVRYFVGGHISKAATNSKTTSLLAPLRSR